ncbi:MAG TPA: adenosylcobinamide-phosphate synthase CbiB, partial [Rubrobacteraceae bacterium]|nr:adenosylcobinamide-phosphate synthase CbiB [Rubrobacteraceae bacterium]
MSARHGGEVAVALILDALVGEPPESLHPTVWMGRVISAFEERAVELKGRLTRRLAGIVLAAALPTVVYLSVQSVLALAPRPLRRVLGAALISTSLSMRGLGAAAGAVERELLRGDLEQARARVGEMVGRDTERLSETEVARAAVESVAENASDGVVAPMLYGLLFGAPGALTYKTINTLDSMVGYRTGPYRELGWASARLDDIANLLPARVTVLAAGVVSGRPGRTLGAALRYGPLTASPNAGWAEAAFAGVLGLRLGGANVYGGVIR